MKNTLILITLFAFLLTIISCTPEEVDDGFNLISPVNNSSEVAINETFICESVETATLYRFYFEYDGGATLSQTSISPEITASVLSSNTIYRWYVEVELSDGFKRTTPKWSFETANPPNATPIAVDPLDEAFVNTTTPTLTWSSVPLATNYTVEVAYDISMNALITEETIPSTAFTMPLSALLMQGVTYYWRIKANNSLYSQVYSFTVG